MNFDKCVQLGNHYHNQVIEFFAQPTRLPGAHLDSTPFPHGQPLATTNLLSLTIVLPFPHYHNGIIQYI